MVAGCSRKGKYGRLDLHCHLAPQFHDAITDSSIHKPGALCRRGELSHVPFQRKQLSVGNRGELSGLDFANDAVRACDAWARYPAAISAVDW